MRWPKRSISAENDGDERFFDVDFRQLLKKRVPITEWLPKYNLSLCLQDLLAGFTVSLTEIPQGIAYAGIIGLSSEYGLYSCIMGGIVYAVFGSCKDLNIGPTGIMSIMVEPYVTKYGPNVAILLTFISGLIIFFLGLFNLGFVIEYFSYPVIAGFTCAAALEIGSVQLNNFFGIPTKADNFLEAWDEIVHSTDEIKLWDTVLASLSLIFLIFFREIRRFGTLRPRKEWSRTRNIIGITVYILSVARNALIIVIGITIAYSLGKDAPFRLTGEVKGGFPPLQPPPFSSTKNNITYSFSEIISGLGASAIFIPLIAILETVTIAKTFAQGKSVDATQEILALGAINILSSFISSVPIAGTFSRTAINNSSGVQTTLGGVFTSLIVILAIAFLTPTFYYVPKATMAAVIICAMIYLFEYHAFVTMWKNKKKDLIPFMVTIVCCLTISLEYGTLIGIFVNLLFLLYPAARPKIIIGTEKVPHHQGEITVVKPLDNLFFPAAENLRDRVLELEGINLMVVIDGKYIRNVDTTVARSLVVLCREMVSRGHQLIFWNFKDSIIQVCVGLDKTLTDKFRFGEFEDVIAGS